MMLDNDPRINDDAELTVEAYIVHLAEVKAQIDAMPPEQRAKISPPFIAFISAFPHLPRDQQEEAVKSMNETRKSAFAALTAMDAGFPCQCGGTFHYALSRSCCYNPVKNMMYDAYDIVCDKCKTRDIFAVDLPHLQAEADDMRKKGITEHYRLTHAKYERARINGRVIEDRWIRSKSDRPVATSIAPPTNKPFSN